MAKKLFYVDYSQKNNLDKILNKMLKNLDEDEETFLNRLGEYILSGVIPRTNYRTGNLRESWQKLITDDNTLIVYNNVEYAPHVEFGHRTKTGGYVKGYFFLRDTIEETEEQITKLGEDFIRSLLDD